MKQVWLVLATYDILRQKIMYKLMEPGHDANNYIYSWDDRGASWCALGFLGKSRERRLPTKRSLDAPAASKLILGGPWVLPGCSKMLQK